MKIFVDTNIIISLLEGSKGADLAKRLLNIKDHKIGTGIINLMETRAVLTKEKHFPQPEVERLIDWLKKHLDFISNQIPDLQDIENHHKTTLMDTMDTIIFCQALLEQSIPVTNEKEMQDHGAVDPAVVLSYV